MSVQPIDLQTMYSQMPNVANRVAHEQQGAQTNAELQQQFAVNKNAQEIKTVKKAADTESKTALVKDGGGKSQMQQASENGARKNDSHENSGTEKTEIREEYLGRHINITR